MLSLMYFLNEIIANHKSQCRFKSVKAGKVYKRSTSHEVQLLGICILGILAGLVVNDKPFVSVNDQ